MTNHQPYRPFFTCPHTYGVRPWSYPAIATDPCRPTACVCEWQCFPTWDGGSPTIVHCSFYIVHCWTFTFSAKERDSETGLSYFGSRYYSSDLSIWLSVDPQSDKYPSLSPYTYCADNPVKLVDPDGEKFRLIGNNINIAFRNYLLSYDGVNCTNIYDAFSLAEGNPNMIMFNDPNITYKQFSSNYQEVTGVKLKNKDAKKLFEAIKSDYFIEVNLISKESISPDCTFDELFFESLTHEPAYNAKPFSYNPAVEQIMINFYSDDFNAIFNSCVANYGTSDSKFFFNTTGNNTIINPPKGFMLVNTIGKSSEQAQITLIKEILDFYNQ